MGRTRWRLSSELVDVAIDDEWVIEDAETNVHDVSRGE